MVTPDPPQLGTCATAHATSAAAAAAAPPSPTIDGSQSPELDFGDGLDADADMGVVPQAEGAQNAAAEEEEQNAAAEEELLACKKQLDEATKIGLSLFNYHCNSFNAGVETAVRTLFNAAHLTTKAMNLAMSRFRTLCDQHAAAGRLVHAISAPPAAPSVAATAPSAVAANDTSAAAVAAAFAATPSLSAYSAPGPLPLLSAAPASGRRPLSSAATAATTAAAHAPPSTAPPLISRIQFPSFTVG